MRTPYLARIIERRPAYYGGAYDLELMGFGKETPALAVEHAGQILARLRAAPRVLACAKTVSVEPVACTYHAEFYRGCDVCKITGVKPGCKRKKCEACGGLGTIPGHGGT